MPLPELTTWAPVPAPTLAEAKLALTSVAMTPEELASPVLIVGPPFWPPDTVESATVAGVGVGVTVVVAAVGSGTEVGVGVGVRVGRGVGVAVGSGTVVGLGVTNGSGAVGAVGATGGVGATGSVGAGGGVGATSSANTGAAGPSIKLKIAMRVMSFLNIEFFLVFLS